MGLPHTVAGIIGFMVFVGFIGLIINTNTISNDKSMALLSGVQNATNRAVNSSDSIDGVISMLTLPITIVTTTFTLTLFSLLAFFGMITALPAGFWIIYPIIFMLAITAIIHIIWWGES